MNYSGQDVLGILRVLPFFSLVLFVPGYLAGMATNALGFRSAKVAERIALALLLSSTISPYLICILGRALSIPVISGLFLLLGFLFFANVVLEWRRNKFELPGAPHWTTKALVGLVALWLFVCLASLPDLQLDHRLYSTAAVYDHGITKRIHLVGHTNGSATRKSFPLCRCARSLALLLLLVCSVCNPRTYFRCGIARHSIR